ncbi:MAG: dsDNA nuclease domain-containing protein [Pseudoalteromonas sp.]|uniref:HamA C-terminal domain-containing protein n=1 Tax=Pseudoalteromonas sp. TaxID=53249 RepID=UPI00384E1F39
MTSNDSSLSVMEQSDSGAPGALKGYNYQHLTAAYFVLGMLRDKSLKSVRCEVIDDIDLVYEDRIDYVQVKTTDNDTKWSLKEFAESSVKKIPPQGSQIKHREVSQEDSILHKSMSCDKINLKCNFRIVTLRDVKKELQFLKVAFSARKEKLEARDKLLAALKRKMKYKKHRSSPEFKSPNGKDIEYWLDNTIWIVIPSIEQLELLCIKLILQAANDHGIYLDANRDPEYILNNLLVNLSGKAAESRVLKSTRDKSYSRFDFITWFIAEASFCASRNISKIKVYSSNEEELKAVIYEFCKIQTLFEPFNYTGDKVCTGLHRGYHREKYDYLQIAKNLCSWIPAFILLPDELADHSPKSFSENINTFFDRLSIDLKDLNVFISRVLLYSVIRTSYQSQPIAASLYLDRDGQDCFDNIHILLSDHEKDSLIMGFSNLLDSCGSNNIDSIISSFDNLLSSDVFTCQMEKILEVKDDRYLLKHDIDEILDSSTSLDKHLSRFRFAFFIGYESPNLSCDSTNLNEDYLKKLESEIEGKFKLLIDKLILTDRYFGNLHIDVYIYPIPSLNKLNEAIKKEVESKWKSI